MKVVSSLLVLAVIAVPMSAGAMPPDVKELAHSTEVFNRCAKIADEISAMRVPPGHAQARAMAAANAGHPAAKGIKVAIDPVHDRFMKDIDEKVHRFDACGKEYEVSVKASEALIEKLGTMNISEADGNAIADTVKRYHASKDTLTDSVAKLSNDIQIQSYVHHTLRDHFLKDYKKG